jgi:CO/xanthine dehydrogenase FAD-binding subunit
VRGNVPDYELKIAKTLDQALDLLAGKPGEWRAFAGGTDLMVLLESGKLGHRKYVSIWNLRELRGIDEDAAHVSLGALTTYTEIQRSPLLREEFPMLCQAGAETGAVAIQNRGTLGGNIANASPAADSPPALLVYDAELELVSKRGSRWVPYTAFHSGYKKMDLQPDELIARVRLPRRTRGMLHYYRKVGTRRAQAISKVCFSGLARIEGGVVREARIALGSVAPVPIRCTKTEWLINGKSLSTSLINAAKAELAREITPIDDIRSTAVFRAQVAQNLLEDFLCGTGSPN